MSTGNKHAGTDLNMAKIANDTETFKVATVSSTVCKAIQTGRQAKGLTQKDLATVPYSTLVVTHFLENL